MTISGKALVAGVIGWPVSHSRSPRLHNYWLQAFAIDGVYVPLAVEPARVERAIRALPALGFAGTNVTLPHKEAAFRAVDNVDEVARRIGAVNTIVAGASGSLHGSNTDAFGFVEALRARVPGWSLSAPAVVIGAGGAARAVLVALQDLGAAEIRLVNRTHERAVALVEALGPPLRAVPWTEREEALRGAALLVNTTTLGMTGTPPLELRLDALPADAVVNDIVYVPLETPLLAAAAARGNVVVDGLEMLLHQARPGFAAWFGRQPEVTDELRAYMRRDLEVAR